VSGLQAPQRAGTDLHSDGFDEHFYICGAGGASWSVSHGAIETIKNLHDGSFKQGIIEAGEGNDDNPTGERISCSQPCTRAGITAFARMTSFKSRK